MAYCSNCGREMPLETGVCPYCGNINRSFQEVQPYATGGLIAWSIITLLLCTIPGIVALVQVSGINNCMTVEMQQQKIKSVKTWCTVGTVLGVLSFISMIVTALASASSY